VKTIKHHPAGYHYPHTGGTIVVVDVTTTTVVPGAGVCAVVGGPTVVVAVTTATVVAGVWAVAGTDEVGATHNGRFPYLKHVGAGG
jgi:hypothetical protein